MADPLRYRGWTVWLVTAAAAVALGAGIWQSVAGRRGIGLWLTVLAVALFIREPMRRYWRRVEEVDPAAPALRTAWMTAIFALAALALGITQLAGIGFREDRLRGFLGLVGGGVFAFLSARALSDHRRLRPPHSGD